MPGRDEQVNASPGAKVIHDRAAKRCEKQSSADGGEEFHCVGEVNAHAAKPDENCAVDTIPLMRRPLTIFFATLAISACETTPKASLEGAQSAYRAGNYQESLRLARAFQGTASGIRRDDAAYIIGLSLLAQDDPLSAIDPLREATCSVDPALRAEALVSLGTAMIALEEYEDAARAYAQAAGVLDGAPSQRAHATAARCFARAGLTVESAREARDSAGAQRFANGNGFGSTPVVPVAAVPQSAPPAPESVVPQREGFTIQSGAFRDHSKAEAIAKGLLASAKRCGFGEPEVVGRTAKDGRPLFAVQIGVFSSRSDATLAMARLKSPGATVVER